MNRSVDGTGVRCAVSWVPEMPKADRVRVLFWKLPVWLDDVLRARVALVTELELLGSQSAESEVDAAIATQHPDVVVFHAADPDASGDRLEKLLYRHPELRLLSIGSPTRGTTTIELLPSERAFGDVSLQRLVSLMVEDRSWRQVVRPDSAEQG